MTLIEVNLHLIERNPRHDSIWKRREGKTCRREELAKTSAINFLPGPFATLGRTGVLQFPLLPYQISLEFQEIINRPPRMC